MIGRTLGHYTILDTLGKGGMGEVFLAEDLRLKRKIALKILPPEAAARPDRLARFEREAQAVAALNHPNIVTIFSVEESEGLRFLTMEFVEGRTLAETVPAKGLETPRFFEVALPLVAAVAAAHDKGIVHRDLKPANVMMTPDARVKVLDFGLAALAHPASHDGADGDATRTKLTREQVMGTLPYMSPEQASGDRVDQCSDIFSLGVLLYELATGRRPFVSDTSTGLLGAILRDPPPPLRQARPDLPETLERIIVRCLEKEPARRYATAREVAHDLEAAARRPAGQGPERPGSSVAVLPFVDMSPARDQEYFCDGIAEELINALAHVEGLKVVARTSAFAFKGRDVDIREIGRALGVGAVLEGSIRTAGSRLRVTAQLVSTDDGCHLWSERFDRDAGDIFAIQDEITAAIVGRLASRLAPAPKPPSERRPTDDLDAYHLYLRGLYFIARPIPPNIRTALEAYEGAIARDPRFALAHVGVATAYAALANLGLSPPVEGWSRSKAANERALAIDSDLAEAHAIRGLTATYYDWDWELAERSFERCFAENPGHAFAHAQFGWYCVIRRRFDEAVAAVERATTLDPLSPWLLAMSTGVAQASGRFDRALEYFNRATEVDPTAGLAYLHMGMAYGRMGRLEEARAAFEASLERVSYAGWGELLLACIHMRLGDWERAARSFDEVLGRRKATYQSSLCLALVASGLGKADLAAELMAEALDERDTLVALAPVMSEFEALTTLPRVRELYATIPAFRDMP